MSRPAPVAPHSLRIALPLVVFVAVLASLIGVSGADDQIRHGGVVPEAPRQGLPQIQDGVVNASVAFRDMVVVAGQFQNVKLPDGTIVRRSNIMAYDIDTGELVDWFDPIVNREVLALDVADDGSGLLVAGRFTKIDGISRNRVAKLDRWGEVDRRFEADVDAKVNAIVDDGERVYVGGGFASIDGEARRHLAALDLTTGEVDAFRNDLSGDLGVDGGSSVRALDLHPDGNLLLVASSNSHIDGKQRVGVAQIDLRTDEVTDWRTDWYRNARRQCEPDDAVAIRDAEYSPDGSFFVVVEKGRYKCDKAVAFPTADGAGLEQNLWVTALFDSVFSVGVSDAAVYVGGHFCYVKALGPIHTDDAATYTFDNKPEPCDAFRNQDRDGHSARYQLAALHPQTGVPLDWNPTTNAFSGVFDIEVIDRGLLLGLDRDQVNFQTTGRHAFIEIGPGGPRPPEGAEPGYYLLGADGTVYTFGAATDRGSADVPHGAQATAIAVTRSGGGYLVVGSDWSVYPFGDVPTMKPRNRDVSVGDTPVDIRIDPYQRGYWIFTDTGRVVAVGDVPHLGDVSDLELAGPVIAGDVNPTATGYRMLGTDGGVFSFGADRFLGSIPEVLPRVRLDCPIVGLVASGPDGYWLVACDGGVFAFGNAPFLGSLPGIGVSPRSPINAMVPYERGYLLVAGDGGVFAFGGPFLGSLGNQQLNSQIVAVATTRR